MQKNILFVLSCLIFCSCVNEPDGTAESSENGTALSDTLHLGKKNIKITQFPPDITYLDLGKEGSSHGDLLAYDARFVTDDGVNGILSGYLLTIYIPKKEEKPFQEKLAQVVFDFNHGNTLVIAGKAAYPDAEGSEMQEAVPQYRAVVGGTGIYSGAKGQLITTRQTDGTYHHVIEFVE